MQTTEFIWFDGKLVPWDSAKVQSTTHSLHYGSAIFEGIRADACARWRIVEACRPRRITIAKRSGQFGKKLSRWSRSY